MRIGFAKIDSKERLQLYGDTKKKISKANKGNKYGKKKVICLELKRIFNSAKEASEYLDYNLDTFYHSIKKGYKCRGLTFKYITIIEL